MTSFAAQRILAPISKERACGPDPMGVPDLKRAFVEIRELRERARQLDRAAVISNLSNEKPETEWIKVRDKATAFIGSSAKHIEIVSILIDAETRIDGFTGLLECLKAFRGLVEGYWSEIHPTEVDLVDIDDWEGDRPRNEADITRLLLLDRQFSGNGTLADLIQKVRILNAKQPNFSLFGLEGQLAAEASKPYEGRTLGYGFFRPLAEFLAGDQSRRLSSDDLRAFASDEPDRLMRLQVLAAYAAETPESEIEGVHKVVCALREEVTDVETKVRAVTGIDYFGVSELTQLLDKIAAGVYALGRVRRLAFALPPTVEEVVAQKVDEVAAQKNEVDAPASGDQSQGVGKRIHKREEAIHVIQLAADFFRRAEPHSLIRQTLDEAARRAGLSVTELLKELIPDEGTRRKFYERSGSRAPSGSVEASALGVAATPMNHETVAQDCVGGTVASASDDQVPAEGFDTRDKAIFGIKLAADFFRRTDPHSPIAWTLDEAARRADLSLTELVKELIPDDSARQKFFELSGSRDPGGSLVGSSKGQGDR